MTYLYQRQKEYENSYDYSIIKRIPVVLKLDGRSFAKLIKPDNNQPFCHKTAHLLNNTALALAKQIEGVVFGYQFSDKIVFIIKNDQTPDTTPWFGNKIQKIVSTSASFATYEFMRLFLEMGDKAPKIEGAVAFSSFCFGIPNIGEAINYLILQQFHCVQLAIDEAVKSVLYPKFGDKVFSLLENKTLNQKEELLEEIGFDFDKFPINYRNGTGIYFIPTLKNTQQGQETKHKLIVDNRLFSFTENKDTLFTIIKTGSDIFRPERDL